MVRERITRLAAVLAIGTPFVLGLTAAAERPPRRDVVFAFHDPEIVESSGLVVDGDLALTVNDSGDAGRVFAVDTRTGETVGVTGWAESPTDVEALAPAGGGHVWVGDIGDNRRSRDAISVSRVPVGRGERSVDEPSYDLSYPDGPRDAEALLVHPESGRLYVVTKGVFGGELLQAPVDLDEGRPNRLDLLGPVLPITTDGAFFPDGRHLVLRSYSQGAVYAFPSLDLVGSFDLPDQEQGEGLAVVGQDELWLSSEGQDAPVLRLALPKRIAAEVAPEPERPARTPSPDAGEQSTGSDLATELLDRDAWWVWLTGAGVLVALLVLMRALRSR